MKFNVVVLLLTPPTPKGYPLPDSGLTFTHKLAVGKVCRGRPSSLTALRYVLGPSPAR